MVRLGKTFGNLMVDVLATNDKLHSRVKTGRPPRDGRDAGRGGDRARHSRMATRSVAIVSLLADVDAADGAGASRSDPKGGVRAALDS